MKPGLKTILVASFWIGASFTSRSASLFFDFGDSSLMTVGNYNNVIHTNATLTPGPSIGNAIDTSGGFTGISLSESGFNTGDNQSGTTTPTGAASLFDSQATRDSLFGHTVVFNGQGPLLMGTLTISGLNPSAIYDFVFFASRTGVTDNREALYTVIGANTLSSVLDAANNTANVATILGISPTGAGGITVQVSPGPNNNNSSGFFYLGAMEMTQVPEPSTTVLSLVGGTVLLLASRRYRTTRAD